LDRRGLTGTVTFLLFFIALCLAVGGTAVFFEDNNYSKYKDLSILVQGGVLLMLTLLAMILHTLKRHWKLQYGWLELLSGFVINWVALTKMGSAAPMSLERAGALLAGTYVMKRGLDVIVEAREERGRTFGP